jgi:hypothetical protein
MQRRETSEIQVELLGGLFAIAMGVAVIAAIHGCCERRILRPRTSSDGKANDMHSYEALMPDGSEEGRTRAVVWVSQCMGVHHTQALDDHEDNDGAILDL